MSNENTGQQLSIVDFAVGTDGDYDLWACLVGQKLEHISIGEGQIVDVERRKNLPPLIHVRFTDESLTLFIPEGFAKGVFTRLTFPAGFEERVTILLARKAQAAVEAEAQARRLREEAEARIRERSAERRATSSEEGRAGDESQCGWNEYESLGWPSDANLVDPDARGTREEVAPFKRRLIERQQRDRPDIDLFLGKRQIRHLVHFTRVENLASILRHGIVPRAMLEFPFVHNDEVRADGYPDASCLSIEFPHYEMFYKYRCKEILANWAVLQIAVGVVNEKPCMFFPGNASSSRCRTLVRAAMDSLMGYAGLEGMFAETQGAERNTLYLPENFPTDPQAEVLVFDVIEPTFVRQVCLLKPDPQLVAQMRDVASSLPIVNGGPLFAPRCDWEIRKRASSAEVEASTAFSDDIPF